MDSSGSLDSGEEEPPDKIRKIIEDKVGEPVIYLAESDLNRDGFFDREYLAVIDGRILVLNRDYEIIGEYRLRDIDSIEVRDYLGGGEIEVEVAGRYITLIRFTRSKVDEFRKLVRVVYGIKYGGLKPEYLNEDYSSNNNSTRKTDTLRRLLKYLLPYKKLGALALALSLILTGLNLAPPYLFKILIDDVLTGGNVSLLPNIIAMLIAVYALKTIVDIGRSYILSVLSQKVVFDMRKELFEHIQKLSLGFYDKYSSGRLLSRITSDTSRIMWFLTWGVQSLVINTLTVVGIGVIIFSIDWRLSLFALAPVPIVVAGIYKFKKKSRRIYHKAWRKWSDVNVILVDTIPGAIVVKSFNREDYEFRRFISRLRDVVKANINVTKLRLEFFPALGFIMSLGGAVIWWIGGMEVLKGTLTLGTLTAFISYMWQFYGPIQSLSNLIQPLQEALTSGERVFEILNVKPEIEDQPDSVVFKFKGHIKFENVCFGYEKYVDTVRDINLEIRPGEVVGIVGPSGSGKTTLMKLLLRFYDPSSGRILIDGVDIRKIKLSSLRRQIGIVLQEPILFSGTIAHNIAYGKLDAEPEEIIAAAKAAYAHNFIMKLPLAYDSPVGERGSRLSGGERQRIAIARALITDPKILILDEATSSVDTITERLIQKALENLIKGRTTIIIAHRLSTVKNADKIVVMHNGRIVEVGTHSELLRRNGLYKRLWEAQFEETKVEAIKVR